MPNARHNRHDWACVLMRLVSLGWLRLLHVDCLVCRGARVLSSCCVVWACSACCVGTEEDGSPVLGVCAVCVSRMGSGRTYSSRSTVNPFPFLVCCKC
eukprot:6788412-Prymnesium_polylepis.1